MKPISAIYTRKSTIHKSPKLNRQSQRRSHSQNIESIDRRNDPAIVTQSPQNVERAEKMKSIPIAQNQILNLK
jgi:hypothetical protein